MCCSGEGGCVGSNSWNKYHRSGAQTADIHSLRFLEAGGRDPRVPGLFRLRPLLGVQTASAPCPHMLVPVFLCPDRFLL